MNDSVTDFPLGEPIPGTNAQGVVINTSLEGRTYEFPITATVALSLGMQNRLTGVRIVARIFRNNSGGVLLGGTLCRIDPVAGIAGLGKVTAAGIASARLCYVVDPMVVAAGVQDGELFFGIVRGPTTVLLAAAGEAITAGDVMRAGASGRTAKAAAATEAHLTIGTILATSTQAATVGKQIPILLHPAWD